MGRPREHSDDTRAALIVAAERIVSAGGPAALSVRSVADEADTTTRAVYSLFGSKDGLVDALALRAFDLLAEALDELPETTDPAGDLIEVGLQVIRRFVLEHPSLHRIAFHRIVPGLKESPDLAAARGAAHERLQNRLRRLEELGGLGKTSVDEATIAFNATCEGLANFEMRGRTFQLMTEGQEEQAWRDALATVIRGFARVSQH